MIIDSPIISGSLIVTGSAAFTGSLTLSGSMTTVGTITATTLVVQTITSSVTAMTGSTRFGTLSSNTHQFTGSVLVSGSLVNTGSNTIFGDLTLNGNRNIYLSNTNPAAGAIRFFNAASGSTKSAIGSYFNVADEGNLEFLTGGTSTRMVITSAGNVGIGTTTTNTNVKLKIKATSEGTDIGLSSSTLCVARISTDTQLNIGYYTTPDAFVISSTYGSDGAYKPLVFATSDTERIRIATNGTTTIAGTFVQSPSSGTGGFYIDRGTSTNSPYISWFNGSGLRLGYMGFSNTNVGLYLENSAIFAISGNVSMARFSATVGFTSYTPDGLFNANSSNCRVTPPGGGEIRFGYNDYGGGQYWGRIGFSQTTNWSLGGIGSAGNDFSIGTGYQGVQLYIYANGNYDFTGSDVSDRRKKTNINYITTNQLDNILKLKPVTFNKITDEVVNENVHTGFIAQDIMEDGIPNLVMGSDEGGYGLDYNGILSLAVKAIQELNTKLDAANAEIALLKAK